MSPGMEATRHRRWTGQGEPWLRRPDWAMGRLEPIGRERSGIVFLWIFTGVWCAASGYAALEAARGNATGQTELAPIFPAIGLGLVALATWTMLHWRRWRRTWLELKTRPGVLGGPFEAVLHAPLALARARSLRLTIDCHGTPDDGGELQIVSHLWHYTAEIPQADFERDFETRVPIALRLPSDLPEAEPARRSQHGIWRLRLAASLSGPDYSAEFDLPVFETADSKPDEPGSGADLDPEAAAAASRGRTPGARRPTRLLPGSKIRERPWGITGTRYVLGMLRNPWLGLFVLASTLLFCGFVAMILAADGPGFFALVFGLATALLAYSAIDTLFGVTHVFVERGAIRVRHGPFGLGPTREAGIDRIERIRAVPGWSSGETVLFQVRIELRGRSPRPWPWQRRIVAGMRIPTRREAETLARAMRRGIGLH